MSLKSWGFELWDQADKVFLYTTQGVEQVDTFYKLMSDIHKIYSSLAKKYKMLSIPPTIKAKLVLESSTYVVSFGKIYQNMADQSSIFDSQVDEIKNQVLHPIKTFLDSSKFIIKEQTNELAKFKQRLEKSKSSLDIAWSKYFGAYIIKKRAEAAYNRVKDDKTIPRLDIEKFQAVSHQKSNDLEKVKSDYASCLQQFNKERCTLYLKDLPKIFSELEMVDRIRAEVTTEAGLALVNIQESHLGKTGVCNVSFGEAIKMIDFKADSRLLVDSNKTTLLLPPDFVFVDLAEYRNDSFNPSDFPALLQQGGKIEKNDSAKSLFSIAGLKGIEIKEMLQSQVKCRLDEISSIIPMVEKELVGIKTLFESYRKDPGMGDKAKLDPQIDSNERKLTSLKDMQEVINLHYQSNYGGKSSSQSHVMTKKPSVAETPDSDEGSFEEDDEDDFDSHETQQSVDEKLATVLYSFESTDPQQLTVESGQKVQVVNYDDGGTGWTLVHQMNNVAIKGYVPTNYIQLQ